MDPHLPLIGRGKERARVHSALAGGEPLLLSGSAGIGKTRLLRETLRAHPTILYVEWQSTLHGLLVALSRALIQAQHAEFLLRARPGKDAEFWLGQQSSIRLKGLLWSAVETNPIPIVLDGVAGAGIPTYRFLQRVYHARGMALFAASRDLMTLGALGRLYWDPARILNILPLHERDAAQLFDRAAGHFKLHHLDLSDFREKVLESAHGNPGQIIEMCRRATESKYVSGRYVKFALLRIDTMMKFAG